MLKLDEFRALAHVEEGRCTLLSRNGNTFKQWPALNATIAGSLRASSGVLDGEVVSELALYRACTCRAD